LSTGACWESLHYGDEMKISISAGTPSVSLSHMILCGELPHIFHRISQWMVDGVDLFLGSTEETDARTLKRLSSECNVGVILLSPLGQMIHDGITLSSPEQSTRKEFIRRAPRHLELAAELDAIVPIGFSRGPKLTGESDEPYNMRLLDSLVQYDNLAGHFGVRLAIEPINRYEINSINTVAEAVSLIRNGSLERTGVLADLFHMNIEEVSIEEALRFADHLLFHVHFSDSNRCAPGLGHTDLQSAFRALEDAQYCGYLGIEALPFPTADLAVNAAQQFLSRSPTTTSSENTREMKR
jgi:sugar phosphate isomerase/epimerase